MLVVFPYFMRGRLTFRYLAKNTFHNSNNIGKLPRKSTVAVFSVKYYNFISPIKNKGGRYVLSYPFLPDHCGSVRDLRNNIAQVALYHFPGERDYRPYSGPQHSGHASKLLPNISLIGPAFAGAASLQEKSARTSFLGRFLISYYN